MNYILRKKQNSDNGGGLFHIRRMRPGAALGKDADPSFGPLSVIDHANLGQGALVSMHEHNNDEILSYMFSGSMVHVDSINDRVALSSNKLMMMNAGRSFWHEETAPFDPVEMLQIFIRPREADLEGNVQFFDRKSGPIVGQWSHIGGPEDSDAPLIIRQNVSLYDIGLNSGDETAVPHEGGQSTWLYVMDGCILVDGDKLEKGDALAVVEGVPGLIKAETDTTLVAFKLDLDVPMSRNGTISGR